MQGIIDRTTEAPSMGDDTIKVGTTGTIGSLMTRELESMNSSQSGPPSAPPPAPMKQQSSPVSVPCGAISRKIVQHRNSQNDSSSNSSSSSSSSRSSGNGRNHLPTPGVAAAAAAAAAAKKPQKNAHHVPMLASDGSPKKMEKKNRIRIVEVVDLKCNNPMSSRLKKLGFSKLSETIS